MFAMEGDMTRLLHYTATCGAPFHDPAIVRRPLHILTGYLTSINVKMPSQVAMRTTWRGASGVSTTHHVVGHTPPTLNLKFEI
jgi:hypothetical protein